MKLNKIVKIVLQMKPERTLVQEHISMGNVWTSIEN